MKRLPYAILLVFLLSGCGGALKSRWNNFTAYYNTFYNARQSYKAGLEKTLAVNPTYNPQQPIRIHEPPVNSGGQDFQKAIEKGAEILRKYPDSKWLDDALLLIGNSYHFRSDFFSADQKYQELYRVTEDASLRQQAVIWRGRLLLDMEILDEGIEYLNAMIESPDINWKPDFVGEARAILAQLYVADGNYEPAIRNLLASLSTMNSKKYRARAFFLAGQLYEFMGSRESALFAFEQVGKQNAEYELEYLAKRKSAEIARALGNYDQAFELFAEMSRDDKNTEFRAELEYERARTIQEEGDYPRAERLYKELLYESSAQLNNVIRARTYYGLAEVYRFGFDDFEMAAAYYDTSNQQGVAPSLLPRDFNAEELARSFGSYAELKTEINLRDSLLWVASLEKPALDSLLISMRQQKLRAFQNQQRIEEQRQNTLINIGNESQEQGSGGSNGFLNSNNLTLVASSAARFRAVWGNRPLVDNWRVRDVYESELTSRTAEEVSKGEFLGQSQTSRADLTIDLSRIPFEESEQDSVRKELASLNYQLGNLFFVSLGQPDSAAYYFNKVIREYPESEEIAVSYYSLSELLLEKGEFEQARDYAYELIHAFPETDYALRVANFYNIALDQKQVSEDPAALYQAIISDSLLSPMEKADRAAALIEAKGKGSSMQQVLYGTIRLYTEAGKEEEYYRSTISEWYELNTAKDAREALKDSSLTAAQRQQYESVLKEDISDEALNRNFPYLGEAWDRARFYLQKFKDDYPSAKLTPRIELLYEEIRLPEGLENEAAVNKTVGSRN